jgi:tetratricopeptide (TPR) repeat protein
MARSSVGIVVVAACACGALSACFSGTPGLAQSSPLSNCKYYVKTQQDYAQGLPHCRQAIVENPEDAEARFWGAVCLAESGNFDEAWQSFSWLVDHREDGDKKIRKFAEQGEERALFYWQKQFNRGMELVGANDFKAANESFRNATKVYPKKVDAHLNLGYTQVELDDLEGAVATFQTAISMDPGGQTAQVYQWDALTRHLKALREATPPDSQRIATLRGQLHETLEKLLERGPAAGSTTWSVADAELALAEIELEEDKIDSALAHIQRAIAIQPEGVYRLYNIGGEFYQSDRYDAAISALTIFLDTVNDPTDENWKRAFEVRAWCYYYKEDYEKAAPALEQVATMNPQNADTFSKLSRVYLKLGQADKAEANAKKYKELKDKELIGG